MLQVPGILVQSIPKFLRCHLGFLSCFLCLCFHLFLNFFYLLEFLFCRLFLCFHRFFLFFLFVEIFPVKLEATHSFLQNLKRLWISNLYSCLGFYFFLLLLCLCFLLCGRQLPS